MPGFFVSARMHAGRGVLRCRAVQDFSSNLLTSIGVPLLISLLCVGLALPGAWCAARGHFGPARLSLLAMPVLLPPYFAYAGWSLLRAPSTWLGDIIATWPPAMNIAASQALAIGGLALWAAPLASVLMWPAAARVDVAALEALKVDGAGRVQRARYVLREMAGGIALASGVVWLLMLGSAVPLHLAQFRTLAIELWFKLALDPGVGTLLGVWPTALAGLIAAGVLLRVLVRADRASLRTSGDGEGQTPRARARSDWNLAELATYLVWSAGVILPLGLFISAIPSLGFAAQSLGKVAHAAANSLLIAVMVGCAGAVLAAWCAFSVTIGGFSKRAAMLMAAALCAVAILPGVVIGAAVGQVVRAVEQVVVVPSLASMVMAHLLRFGVLAAVVGVLIAVNRPAAQRGLFAAEPAGALRRYLLVFARADAIAIMAIGVVLAVLSAHEIEATVMLAEPGRAMLAQRTIGQLHFNRDQDLAVIASAMMLLPLLACAAIATALRSSGAASGYGLSGKSRTSS